MKRLSPRRRSVAISLAGVIASVFVPGAAFADVTLMKSDGGWEVFTTGRLNAFLSWAKGDNMPVAPIGTNGPLYQFKSAGGTGVPDTPGISDPIYGPDNMTVIGHTQGTVDAMRVRSGFVGNVLGFGLRRDLNENTRFVGLISTWSIVESVDRRKYFPDYGDVREGYLKLEGKWGSLLAGKALTLFDRGATEADFLYMHGYGLGYPGSIGVNGPAAGMIGFGVLASTFSGGFVYATPSVYGVQLSVGAYDPASLVGSRLERTGAVRPEFELTVDEPLGTLGKLHLFFNGTWQKLYARQQPDSFSATAEGIGFGGRLEIGPVHLAAGGHGGKGLGLTFALEPSESTYSDKSELRSSRGFFAIGQFVRWGFDFNVGYGQTKVNPLADDLVANAMTGYPTYSLIYTQTGYFGAVVYHLADWLHIAVDVMHADFKWTAGDRQQINFYNAGTTVTW
ncbi:MAG TPA: porin [Polyangia bacterium]|nr:porin [Polyangia bacterium]